MMKATAERTVQSQVMPGQAGARQSPRVRMEADQVMADFEGLLARQPIISGTPLENREEASPGGQPAQQALASPEVLFLALAGGGDFTAKREAAEQPRTPDSGGDSSVPASDDGVMKSAATMPEPPVELAQPQGVHPQARVAAIEGGQPAKDKSATELRAAFPVPADRADAAAAADPTPVLAASDNERAIERDDDDDGRAAKRDDAEPSGEKKPRAIAEAVSRKEMGVSQASQGGPPVTLIRVAGQETHFAPTPVFLFDDRKMDASTVQASSGPDETTRAQPQSPIALKAPSGPLKTLTVQLGSQELGLINATMALKDKALELRVGAIRDEAVTSLRENAGRLADTLQSLGFSVDGVTVQKMHQGDAAAQTGNGQPMQHNAGGQDGQGAQRNLNNSGFGAEGSSGQSRQSPHDDHLAEQDGNGQANSLGGTRNSGDVFL